MRAETSEDGGGEKHNHRRGREGHAFEKGTVALDTGKRGLHLQDYIYERI